MTILFLTNNVISAPLLSWLKKKETAVYVCSTPIDVSTVAKTECDIVISYNYSHIIKRDVLDLLPNKFINLHTSLLPWNRGASPNIFSFLEDTPSGVSIHLIDEGLDTGDILLQQEIFFDKDTETLKSSYEKSHQIIQHLFIDHWPDIRAGKIPPMLQQGEGSFHRQSDLDKYSSILNYHDTISSFLQKAHLLNK